MNNELESQQNGVTLFHFLALLRRGYGGGQKKRARNLTQNCRLHDRHWTVERVEKHNVDPYKYRELLQYVSPIKIFCILSKVYICGFCTFLGWGKGILPLHNYIILMFLLEIQCVFWDVRSQLAIRGSSIHIAIKIHFCWGVTLQLCEYSSTFRRLLLSTNRQEIFVPAHIQGQAPWRWRHCDASKCRKLVVQYHNVTFQKIWIFRHSTFGRVRKNCEKRLLASSCQSVRPHENRLPPDGFSWNLIFQYFSKIHRENSSFIKMWLE